MKVNRFRIGSRFLLLSLFCLVAVGTFADSEKDKEEDRTEIRQMAQETLTRLYKAQPSAQAVVQKSYGMPFSATRGSRSFLAARAMVKAWPSTARPKLKPL